MDTLKIKLVRPRKNKTQRTGPQKDGNKTCGTHILPQLFMASRQAPSRGAILKNCFSMGKRFRNSEKRLCNPCFICIGRRAVCGSRSETTTWDDCVLPPEVMWGGGGIQSVTFIPPRPSSGNGLVSFENGPSLCEHPKTCSFGGGHPPTSRFTFARVLLILKRPRGGRFERAREAKRNALTSCPLVCICDASEEVQGTSDAILSKSEKAIISIFIIHLEAILQPFLVIFPKLGCLRTSAGTTEGNKETLKSV